MSLIRLFLLLFICTAAPLQAAVKVSVGVEPMRYLVEQIGGERVVVSTLLSSGDPHAIDPTPRQLLSLKRADLYFGVGLPFERGLGERLASAEKLLWLVEDDGSQQNSEHEDHEAGHSHVEHNHALIDGKDPHRWTSPGEMLRMGAQVSASLRRVDPQGEAYYAARLEEFSARVQTLQRFITDKLRSSASTIVVNHPAWGWFCQEFALQQLSVEHEGKLPSIRQMSALKKESSASAARYVVSEHGGAQAHTIASHLGLKLLIVNPLSYAWEESLHALASGLAEP